MNNLKLAFRNYSRNKMFSWIKLGGFALGITSCLLIALFIRDEISFDKHYQNNSRIYRVVQDYYYEGRNWKDVYMQAPFANAIMEDYPEIENSGRINAVELFGAGSNNIRSAESEVNVYDEGFAYADQGLLEVLEFSFVFGELSGALDRANSIVISESKAIKYFNGENPVGKSLILNNDTENPLNITGVFKDLPNNSHISYSFLIALHPKIFYPGEQNNWSATNYYTYILVKPGSNIADLEEKLKQIPERYVIPVLSTEGQKGIDEFYRTFSYKLQPINDIHLHSAQIDDGLSHGDIRFVRLFGAIAIFILLIACVNFINLSTAKSANRAKEVGLKKTLGSKRIFIIKQFLLESIFYSGCSVLLGVFLARVFLPLFNELAGKTLVIPWSEFWFIALLLITILVVGLLSGLYPSFYLSSFKPVSVLSGSIGKGSKSSKMRSGLVIFQFAASIILIISTLTVSRQTSFILNKNIGYDRDQVLLVHGANAVGNKIASFKNEILKLSEVRDVTVSDYLPVRGSSRNGNSIWKEGMIGREASIGSQKWIVDSDYISTLGMKIVQGRDFSEKIASDSRAAIINQTLARKLDLDNPIGTTITNGRGKWHIIGVVEDFHFESLKEDIWPLAMILGNSPETIAIKVNTKEMSKTISSINTLWDDFSPNQSFRYGFLDVAYARMYSDLNRLGRIFASFSVLAIIIACLGLYALSAYLIEQRGKEISIRVVLGASMKGVFGLLTSNFLKLILISVFLSVPISYLLMNKWLEDFAYRIDIGWDIFILAGFLSVFIAISTVGFQSIRASLINPANKLRTE